MSPGELMFSIGREATNAERKYGPFASTHEAYGVLCEEVAELLDAIRSNDIDAVRHESAQVAAVAFRLASERDSEFLRRSAP